MKRTASTGQEIIFVADDHGHVAVSVDGKHVGSGRIVALDDPRNDLTHGIRTRRAVYGMTYQESQVLEMEIAAALPRKQEATERERDEILDRISIFDEMIERGHHDPDHETDLQSAYVSARAARQDLQAYDDAHPEILAAIRAKEQAEEHAKEDSWTTGWQWQ